MPQAIETAFDQDIAQDLILEQIDGAPPAVQTTLKNAENVYKSFLYLRRMYSKFPAKEIVKGLGTVDNATLLPVTLLDGTNYITINNFSASTATLDINGGAYTMQPGENITLPLSPPDSTVTPVIVGDTVSIQGNVSYILKIVQDY